MYPACGQEGRDDGGESPHPPQPTGPSVSMLVTVPGVPQTDDEGKAWVGTRGLVLVSLFRQLAWTECTNSQGHGPSLPAWR